MCEELYKKNKNAKSMRDKEKLMLPSLFLPEQAPPKSRIAKWLLRGEKMDASEESFETHPWYWVIWLTGVDLFSSLGYQPGLALLSAGILSPIATLVLILVTLFGILPVYQWVAERSYTGQGSIALLENFLTGWKSKIFVLVLLGFACTDFVITTTLAASDAARHLIGNPYLSSFLEGTQIPLTLFLILLLAGVFLAGFSEAIGVSATIVIPYLFLTFLVILKCSWQILLHPSLFFSWIHALLQEGSLSHILLVSCIVFPQLALGLSGFETGVSVMPLVKGDSIQERISATKKLLSTAAILICFFLLGSSLVATLLIPSSAYQPGGPADGRALAYLAHEFLGNFFGSLYDFSTILILWFTGASAVAGMVSLISRYLPRYGMAPRWVAYYRPLVLAVTGVDLVVTLIFKANVDAQSGAYATGVLTLFLSAAIASALVLGQEARESHRFPLAGGYAWLVSLVLFYTLVQNIRERPDGLFISLIFILAILLFSALSRYFRATELRVESVSLVDSASKKLFEEICGKKVCLVSLHHGQRHFQKEKGVEMRKFYKIDHPLAFLHVKLKDDRSEFSSDLKLKVLRFDEDYFIEVRGAVVVANTIAYISQMINPYAIFLNLTRGNPMALALDYLLFGQGEIGILVYQILVQYWEKLDQMGKVHDRPFIFLMSH
jgi:hypothetical protein